MALSMTGCGEGIAADGTSTCRVEIRSVNNRSFKLTFRSREGFQGLEGRVEAAVRQRVRRGGVQVVVDVAGAAGPARRELDLDQLGRYLDQLESFAARRGLPVPATVDALLTLPGVVADAAGDAAVADRAWPLVEQALRAAIDRFDAMRRAEGTALAEDMRSCCRDIGGMAAEIATRVPRLLDEHRARLADRVGRLLEQRGVTLSDADLAREVALVAERSAIAEELVRLESHVTQFVRLLDEDSAGRQLDFLTQELLREANTIASKTPDAAVAHLVVEIKARIERLREQVQNLE